MDDSVLAAIARWPNVPNVYGWLSLDRRGRWCLQGSQINNPRITDFISRNYESDARGAWFFQNGPQRVYVQLDYAPWILRIGERQALVTHTGQPVVTANAALIDEAGNLLIAFERGIGLVEDRDLAAMFEAIRDSAGKTPDEHALAGMMAGKQVPMTMEWQALRLSLAPARSSDIPARFGFLADPQPD